MSDKYILLSQGLNESYKSKNKRKNKLNISSFEFEYNINKSSDLWAHYENESSIIVFIHGATAFEQQLTAISKFLKPSAESKVILEFCRKYDSLIQEKKEIMLVGHSLGAWAIAECSRGKKKIPSILFGPYMPQVDSNIVRNMKTTQVFHKIFFTNDFFANNLLKGSGLVNAVVFSPSNIIQFFNSHMLATFTKPITAKFKTF